MDVSHFFEIDKKLGRTIFVGDKCDMYFPVRYANYNLLSHAETLNALGVCDMTLNDELHGGLCIAGMIEIHPSDVNEISINGEPYIAATLRKGDVFMGTNDVLRNDRLVYILWNEMISLGKVPRFINYNNIHDLFDKICDICGVKFAVDHAVFEMVYAHIFRDAKDVSKKYRYTDKKSPAVIIPLRSISYGPDTTIDKIVGSYSNDGINSALVNESTQLSDIEIQLSA